MHSISRGCLGGCVQPWSEYNSQFPLLLMHDEITERMMMARTDESWDGLPVALDFERKILLSDH